MDIHKYVYNDANSFVPILYIFQPHKCKIVIYMLVLRTALNQKFKWLHAVWKAAAMMKCCMHLNLADRMMSSQFIKLFYLQSLVYPKHEM